jgi:hypothetical protein
LSLFLITSNSHASISCSALGAVSSGLPQNEKESTDYETLATEKSRKISYVFLVCKHLSGLKAKQASYLRKIEKGFGYSRVNTDSGRNIDEKIK